MNRKTTVFIVLDAFRWDYVNAKYTPFIYDLSKKSVYVRKLVSSPGFTQRTAMFTGTYPDRSDVFSVFYYDPYHSPYSFLNKSKFMKAVKAFYNTSMKVPVRSYKQKVRGIIIGQIICANAYKYCRCPFPADVPLDVLAKMNYSEDGDVPLWHPGALKIETLFDKLFMKRTRIGYYMHPVAAAHGSKVVELVTEKVKDKEDFYLFQFTESDEKVHHCGPASEETGEIIKSIDDNLKKIKEIYDENYDEVNFILIGDHGMTDVTRATDVQAMVKKAAKENKLEHLRDYLLFVDSTMARLWFFNDKSREVLTGLFSNGFYKENGCLVDSDYAKQKRIPSTSKKWGDLIWRANHGVMIDPCYFHPKGSGTVKGMHGYDSGHDDMKGFLLISNPDRFGARIIEQAKLVDVCPTLCDVMEVEYPADNEGTSIIDKNIQNDEEKSLCYYQNEK